MSFFSDSVGVATTATPNFTVGTYEGPNAGQYGWTKADTGHYNQLIQYVDECRNILTQIEGVAANLTEAIKYVNEIKAIRTDMVNLYNKFTGEYNTFSTKYVDFTTKHAAFLREYGAFRTDYGDFQIKYPQVEGFATNAREAAITAVDSAAKTESDRVKVEAIYEDLKNGQVYRGTWNPNSGAYPTTHENKNSTWDVVLNSGQTSVTFDGKEWSHGDRLVYVEASGTFDQIQTGISGVKSVNGMTGAVTLTYTDVSAAQMVNDVIQIKGGTQGEIFGDATASWMTKGFRTGTHTAIGVSAYNPVYFDGANLREIYHTGRIPTANEVGAVPSARTVNGKPLSTNIALSYEDVGAVTYATTANWSTTGNARTSVVGFLGWQNYGPGHVIFDASSGKSPNGMDIDPVTPQQGDVAGVNHPTLMGWNGTNTYGVRVYSATKSDRATVSNNLGGVVSTSGQDLLIHGKRALAGVPEANILYINYGPDWGETSVQGALSVNGPITTSGTVHSVKNSGSYLDANIEARSIDGNGTPRIGLHRPGVTAAAFRLDADGTVALEAANTSVLAHFVASKLYANDGMDGSPAQLTRKDYVDNRLYESSNMTDRGRRDNINVTVGQGSYHWHPTASNIPLVNTYGHGFQFGGSYYVDGHWVSDIAYIHGSGLYHRATVNGAFAGWDKFAWAGTINHTGYPTRFENSADWFGASFGMFNQPCVVAGSLSGSPTIGGHTHGLDGWQDLFLNAQAGHGGTGGTILGNPHAMEPGNNVSYKIYHQGFRPSSTEIIPSEGGAPTAELFRDANAAWISHKVRSDSTHNSLGVGDNGPVAYFQAQVHRIYHEGFRPTAYDIEVVDEKTKEISTVAEEMKSLREENQKLKAALLMLATKTGVTLEL